MGGGREVRFHAAFEEGWDHVAGPRVRTGVLLCEQGAHRPVAAASKFDPFEEGEQLEHCQKGGKRPAAAGGGSKANKKKK